jgi:rare lipoprotein A (peptidoglycan hydrolase)
VALAAERIIDLLAAAKSLGMILNGIATVRINPQPEINRVIISHGL